MLIHPHPGFAWSLLLAAAVVVSSIVPLGAARSQADFILADLAAPRAMFERLPDWGKRANWAHLNSFESFALFAPAVLLCLFSGVSATAALLAAWIYPGLRLAYIVAYVVNQPLARSLSWAGGMTCIGILYVEGLRVILQSQA